MPERFDPYHKWLGISPKDQPPNHYRLLAIDLFESDPDVIAAAADQRMAHVRSFQTGKNSGLSQKILNEISTAKICLLNLAKKHAYDERLREQVNESLTAARASEPASASSPEALPNAFDFARTATSYRKNLKKKPRGFPWVLAAVVLGCLGVVGIVVVSMNSGNGVLESNGEVASKATEPSQPPTSLKLEPKRRPKPEARTTPKVEPTPEAKPEPSPQPKPPVKPKSQPEPESPAEPRPAPVVQSAEKPPVPDPAAQQDPLGPIGEKRTRVPADAALAKANKLIKEVYGDEYAGAKTATEKQALAKKLLGKANETKDDPASQFVLLRLAKDIATQACDGQTTFQAIDAMAGTFHVDGMEMKAAVLTKFASTAKTPSQQQSIAEEALKLVEKAVSRDDFTVADELGKLALSEARKAREKELVAEAQGQVAEVAKVARAYEAVQQAAATLKTSRDEPQANLTVGKYKCFVKGDWDKGLPMLAQGSDEALKALATQDIQGASSGNQQSKLGDDWWSLAEKQEGTAKKQIETRADYWYQKALPGLSGLARDKVEKRLAGPATIKKERVDAPVVRSGNTHVRPGNILLGGRGITVEGAIKDAECLFDGNTTMFDANRGYASAPIPCEWTIRLEKAYRLQEIRMLLWQQTERFYRYSVALSADGKNFTVVADRSQGEWRGWQTIQFPAKNVKAIKVIGLYNNAVSAFTVVEIEAYCIPPKQ